MSVNYVPYGAEHQLRTEVPGKIRHGPAWHLAGGLGHLAGGSANILAFSGMKTHDHERDVCLPSHAFWSEAQVGPGPGAKGLPQEFLTLLGVPPNPAQQPGT